MATFDVFGPYPIPCEKAKGGWWLHYDRFWEQNAVLENLAKECGVYLFAIRAGKGFTPIYVGKATKAFGQECFNPTNKHKYTDGLRDYAKGSPVIFFVAHANNPGKKNIKEIDQIETFLIQLAARKNPKLQNFKKAKGPSWVINGVVRGSQGKPTNGAVQFVRTVGL